MEKYSSGSRDSPAKGVGPETGAGVRIPPSPVLGTNANSPRRFFVGEAFAFVFRRNELWKLLVVLQFIIIVFYLAIKCKKNTIGVWHYKKTT